MERESRFEESCSDERPGDASLAELLVTLALQERNLEIRPERGARPDRVVQLLELAGLVGQSRLRTEDASQRGS